MSEDFLDPRRAERLARAVRAAQALSETLWEALHEELADPREQRVAELSERLGEVAATVVLLARVDTRAPEARAEPVEPGSVESETRVASVTYDEPRPSGPPSPRGPSLPPDPFATREPLSAAVIVDELTTAVPPPQGPSPQGAFPQGAFPQGASPQERPPQGPFPPQTPTSAVTEPSMPAKPEIEIRDARGEEGPVAWIGSIGRRLERHRQDGEPFAVLLVELVDGERLRHAEPAGEVARLESQVEAALARELRPVDSLTRESPGRYWLLAPQTDGVGARMLAERLARAVRSSASHRGTPLELAVGIAVCPDDGLQASALAAHADVGLYAARAAGRSSIG